MNPQKLLALILICGLFLAGAIAVPLSEASSYPSNSPTDLPVFTETTDSAGMAATLTSWGASWGYLNNDDYPDLLTYSHERLPEMYLNNGDGTFTDIVLTTPLSESSDRHSAAWGDYDNDGDQDISIAVGAQAGTGDHPAELYRNDDSVLLNVAEDAGISDGLTRGRSMSWADYDRDGDLDYFAANHLREDMPNRLWRNNGDGTFTNVAVQAGVADVMAINVGGFVDYDRDIWPDIFILGINENILYHNNGDGTFENVSAATGFANRTGDAYDWGDYDNDGDADLFIGNSGSAWADVVERAGSKIRFFSMITNDEDGFDIFTDAEQLTFHLELRGPDTCITVDCIHIGSDGHSPATNPFEVGLEALGAPVYTPTVSSGYYIWLDEGADTWHVRTTDPDVFRGGGTVTSPVPISGTIPIDLEGPPPKGYAMLFRNEGDGTFSDVSLEAGVDAPGNYRTVNWVDFDNDGWADLFAADKGNLKVSNPPNHLFRNNGDGTFTEVTIETGVQGTTEGGVNTSAWADVDGNGFLDLFTQNGGFGGLWPFDKGPNQLFINEGNTNHWLQLKLSGVSSNRSGLGAVVRLTTGGRTLILAHSDGKSAYSQDTNSLHFGLGDNEIVESIVIDWPSGIQQVLTNVPVDQIYTIIEPSPIFLPLLTK
jgi:hypothetical protein